MFSAFFFLLLVVGVTCDSSLTKHTISARTCRLWRRRMWLGVERQLLGSRVTRRVVLSWGVIVGWTGASNCRLFSSQRFIKEMPTLQLEAITCCAKVYWKFQWTLRLMSCCLETLSTFAWQQNPKPFKTFASFVFLLTFYSFRRYFSPFTVSQQFL